MDKYRIGASSLKKAEQIALKHGLNKTQWRRAHGGMPSRLLDGIRVSDRKFLIGDFSAQEWWVLTAHLPEQSDGAS